MVSGLMRATLVASVILITGAPFVAEAQPAQIDAEALVQAMSAQGFQPPERFKALVGIVQLVPSGETEERWFDWSGTSSDRDDWWPASTIKLYAAVAALARNRRMGFRPSAILQFHYTDEEPVTRSLREIVRRAIIQSDNHAFNRLVEFVGFNELNQRFFTARRGLEGTVFLRAYNSHRLHPDTGYGLNRASPRITIQGSGRERVLPLRNGRGNYQCPEQGNCTTLRSLAEVMRRVMLHEHLPVQERYRLRRRELRVLRGALLAPRREHGRLLVEALRRGFGDDESIEIYHKPGFAYRWSSEVIAVRVPSMSRWFFIAAAAWPGRRSLDGGLENLARVLSEQTLSQEGS